MSTMGSDKHMRAHARTLTKAHTTNTREKETTIYGALSSTILRTSPKIEVPYGALSMTILRTSPKVEVSPLRRIVSRSS